MSGVLRAKPSGAGHTVHFKGVLRLHSASAYSVPAAVKIGRDSGCRPENRSIKVLTTNANGTIPLTIWISRPPRSGTLAIQVKAGGDLSTGPLRWKTTRSLNMKSTRCPAKARVIRAKAFKATIDALATTWRTVAGAKEVKYAVYREHYWLPVFYDPDDDSPRR